MSEPFVEIANLSLPPPLDQNNVDFLPDSYDPESWPKDLASPLSYVQQISDKIKTFSVCFFTLWPSFLVNKSQHEFREAEYSKPGFFKFHFKVTVVHPEGLLEQEYDASALKYFTSKRHAQQAAAYMFVLYVI